MAKKVWTNEMQEFLDRFGDVMSVKKISQKLKVSEGTIYRKLYERKYNNNVNQTETKQRPKAEYSNAGYLSLINNNG